MASRIRQRLGWSAASDGVAVFTSDRSIQARALMYLLAAVGTAIVVSTAVPGGPLEHENTIPILAAIAYAAAIGVLVGFDKLPRWGFHALLLAVTALICWAIYKSGEAGSPYNVFFFWVAIYAAFFMSPVMTGVHIAAMIVGYGIVLLALGDKAQDASLHWALTTSALVLVGVAIQALNASVRRLIERLTEIGRVDSLTGLYNAAAFTEMLANETERSRRSGNRMGVIVADIDGFAPVGNRPLSARQEHQLATVGEIFGTTPRQIDMAARVGGSRFALVLPYTDEHGAYLLAERLRSALREAPVSGEPVSMSFGVAGFPRHGASGPAVFQSAETALVEAEEAGGGRVMLFQRTSGSVVVEIETTTPEELIG